MAAWVYLSEHEWTYECFHNFRAVYVQTSSLFAKRVLSLSLRLTVDGYSALHADRFIATLLAHWESPVLVVTCSTQRFRGWSGCLLQVPNCPEPCHVVSERCRAWWAGSAWFICLTWPKKECLLWLIASFMDGNCERVETSSFMTNSRGCQVSAFG